MKKRFGILICISLCCVFMHSALAWKPSSHVYLGREALAEVDEGTTLIPFYRVDYANQEKLELIGNYPANETLVNILRNNRDSFYTGIVGPDAFPDLPTGQTRIHIPCPDDLSKVEEGHGCPTGQNHTVISDQWLQHIWSSALEDNQSDAVRAFAFGFLTHAAGDMFMHTFVNHFAGGPFSSLSDNGLRHFLIETYVGKKTPELSASEYDISLDNSVQKFIYEKLTYAKSGSPLDTDLLIDIPVTDVVDNAIFFLSVPRYFSTLKNQLDFQINTYDNTIAEHNETISDFQAQLSDCVDRSLDLDILNDCSAIKFVELASKIGAEQLARDLYMTPRLIPMEYAREWSQDIEQGLFAWPAFSHEVLRAFVFSPNGMDKLALTEAWEDYKNNYFLKMLGIPDAVGNNAAFIDEIKDSIYTIETRRWVEDLKLSFIDRLIRLFTLEQHTLEDLENFVKSPEANIPRFVNQPPIPFDNDDVSSIPVSVAELDSIMALNNGVFDVDQFSPAHNTLTMLKLMLLSEEGIFQLYRDLKCPNTLDCNVDINTNDPNAMLGFIRTLDGGNEWHNHNNKMWFAECDVYQQIFMRQLGESANIGENCEPPLPQLIAPEIIPEGNTFDTPTEISIQHENSEASIYYTISFEGQAAKPTNEPNDSRSTLYNGPFTLSTPFTGAQPLIVRAKAFKNGFEASDTIAETFVIDSEQSAPSFFPNNIDYFGNVDISIDADDGSSIFYTTNGEDPTYLSTSFVKEINFGPGEHTLKAIAYRVGYAPSEVSEFSFRVYSANDEDLIATPRFNPAGSTTTVNKLEVSIFVDAEGVDIYYTIADGFSPDEPTVNDKLYSAPLILGLGNHFIKAKAFDPNDPARVSISRQIRFTIDEAVGETEAPEFDPPPGTYFNTVKVQANAVTNPENAGTPVIGFTTDGTDPVIDIVPQFPTRKYNGNFINVFNSTVIKAQAVQKLFLPSDTVRAEYRLQVAQPFSDPPSDKYQNSVEIFLDSETEFPKLHYTLDGSEPTTDSAEYILKDNLPIILDESATLKVKGFKFGYFDSEVFSANYIVEQLTVPTITQHPLSQKVYEGTDVKLMVAASGNPAPSFQWYKDNEVLSNETQAYLILNNTQLTDSADYHAEVSNDIGTINSDKATIEIDALPSPPVITRQPQSKALQIYDNLNLDVDVESEADVAYQWFFNGQKLAEQTQQQLDIKEVKLPHAGVYHVVVSNRGGEMTSQDSVVTVSDPDLVIDLPTENRPPKISKQPSDVSITEGNVLQLSIEVDSSSDIQYLWFHEQTALSEARDALLIINNINQNNAGEYFVLVQNKHGSVISEKASVTVTEKTVVNEDQDNTDNTQEGDAQDKESEQTNADKQNESPIVDDQTPSDNNENSTRQVEQKETNETQVNSTSKGSVSWFLVLLLALICFFFRLKKLTRKRSIL